MICSKINQRVSGSYWFSCCSLIIIIQDKNLLQFFSFFTDKYGITSNYSSRRLTKKSTFTKLSQMRDNPNAKFRYIHWKKTVPAVDLQIYLKKELRRRCFLIDFAKFLRTALFHRTSMNASFWKILKFYKIFVSNEYSTQDLMF